MAAALLCDAGASPVHKVSLLPCGCGSPSDRGPRACANTCVGQVAMVKNGAHGRRARLVRARRTQNVSEVASTFAQGLPVVFKLGENHFIYELATRVNLIIGRFLQLCKHGNGMEFGTYSRLQLRWFHVPVLQYMSNQLSCNREYGRLPRRNVCM